MAKGDYTDADTIVAYRGKMREQTLSAVTVAANEKRDRAELLDMVEELFSPDAGINRTNLRAFLHIIVKACSNSSDDVAHIVANSTATLPTEDPRVEGKMWNSENVVTISTGE